MKMVMLLDGGLPKTNMDGYIQARSKKTRCMVLVSHQLNDIGYILFIFLVIETLFGHTYIREYCMGKAHGKETWYRP